MRDMYRLCATERLFIPDMFPDMEKAIFMDTDLKPYLLEVNTIPSLFINQVSKEVDVGLKAPLMAELFNICGHHISSGILLIPRVCFPALHV